MKRLARRLLIALLVLVVIGALALFGAAEIRRASPTPDALAALVSDPQVSVSQDDLLVFKPGGEPSVGVILYPGASCDVRGYAPLLRRIAAQGYLVVAVPMPFDMAIFGVDRASKVQATWPRIREWVLIGHSMGGAMASQFAHDNPDALAGLILWDSYPPEAASLAASPLPVWHIHRATTAGTAPPAFETRRRLFPAESVWVPVPGGLHMYFGSFEGGYYREQWAPSISRRAQQDEIVAATLRALAGMTDR